MHLAGDTLDSALSGAVEALSGHVRMMEADGDPIPSPRSLDDIMADPQLRDDRERAVVSAVPLLRDRGSTVRINVSMDLELLEAIDAEARSRGQTRSAFPGVRARRELVE